MESPSIYNPNKAKEAQRGMTLIEIVVVLAVLILIISLGMVTDISAFKHDTFTTERTTIISVLSRARSEAMSNMYKSPHGVCYVEPNYIIFYNRTTCLPTDGNDENIPAETNIASNPATAFPTILFSALTGNSSTATIYITDGIKSANITINDKGTINW